MEYLNKDSRNQTICSLDSLSLNGNFGEFLYRALDVCGFSVIFCLFLTIFLQILLCCCRGRQKGLRIIQIIDYFKIAYLILITLPYLVFLISANVIGILARIDYKQENNQKFTLEMVCVVFILVFSLLAPFDACFFSHCRKQAKSIFSISKPSNYNFFTL